MSIIMDSDTIELEKLQNDWREMYQKQLPEAALSKSPLQPNWPVFVDHCFARIILDATVGIDAPWTSKIHSPAYKYMSKEQLTASIELGKEILSGESDLVKSNNRSLELRRQKMKPLREVTGARHGKRERTNDANVEEDEVGRAEIGVKKRKNSPHSNMAGHSQEESKEDLTLRLKKIALSDKSSFQKKVLTALCQVPRGQYTTYAAISKYLDSSPRAVGNALRNNPFAPQVPCHRVLASGGGLGGFHGSWGRNGKQGLHDDRKIKLLGDEGVRFDASGRVVGLAWDGFR